MGSPSSVLGVDAGLQGPLPPFALGLGGKFGEAGVDHVRMPSRRRRRHLGQRTPAVWDLCPLPFSPGTSDGLSTFLGEALSGSSSPQNRQRLSFKSFRSPITLCPHKDL